jgi:hypothetical protein
MDILLVEQEMEADDTPAVQLVLGADMRRTQLLAEQKELEQAITSEMPLFLCIYFMYSRAYIFMYR